jgi:hypothetical protein
MQSLKKMFRAEKPKYVDQPVPPAEYYLREWGVKYKEKPDGRLEVDDLHIIGRGLTQLPDLSRVDVRQTFDCSHNALTSLKGAPGSANYFLCEHNRLTSLEGAPEKIGAVFDCSDNELETLEGGPRAARHFYCDQNKLLSLKGGPEKASHITCTGNPMETLEGAPAGLSSLRCDYGSYSAPDYGVCKLPPKLLRPVEETAAWQAWRAAQEKKATPPRRGGLNL